MCETHPMIFGVLKQHTGGAATGVQSRRQSSRGFLSEGPWLPVSIRGEISEAEGTDRVNDTGFTWICDLVLFLGTFYSRGQWDNANSYTPVT